MHVPEPRRTLLKLDRAWLLGKKKRHCLFVGNPSSKLGLAETKRVQFLSYTSRPRYSFNSEPDQEAA
jgi:hypothetical protein